MNGDIFEEAQAIAAAAQLAAEQVSRSQAGELGHYAQLDQFPPAPSVPPQEAAQGRVAEEAMTRVPAPESIFPGWENEEQRQRGLRYFEVARSMHEAEGRWELADLKSLIMTNPVSGVASVQFWFVMLIEREQGKVLGEIFTETMD